MKTLPDYLRPGLRMVSIGLNPSLPSVAAGFYFANPRNRFWRAFDASGLTTAPVAPSSEAMGLLLQREGIGFTDVIKRPTAGGASLRATDFRRDAPGLKAKLERLRPGVAWFHGKQAFGIYLRYAENRPEAKLEWGAQRRSFAGCRVYVTPNPSPANAAYSLDDLIGWYRRLARYLGRL